MLKTEHTRKINSYVLRGRIHSTTTKQAVDALWPVYGLDATTNFIATMQQRGSYRNLNIEIGFGMGESFLALARLHQQDFFVGIEVHKPGIGAVLAQLVTEPLPNLALCNADATIILRDCVPDNSVARILLFFPDPWPKRRHNKRRLVQPEFIQLLDAKLQPHGYIHMATDWDDYAQHMLRVMSSFKQLKSHLNPQETLPSFITRPTTKFEQRGLQLGYKIWDLVFEKIPAHFYHPSVGWDPEES